MQEEQGRNLETTISIDPRHLLRTRRAFACHGRTSYLSYTYQVWVSERAVLWYHECPLIHHTMYYLLKPPRGKTNPPSPNPGFCLTPTGVCAIAARGGRRVAVCTGPARSFTCSCASGYVVSGDARGCMRSGTAGTAGSSPSRRRQGRSELFKLDLAVIGGGASDAFPHIESIE